VSEGFSRTAFLKGGWGEIDCFRAEGAFTDNNVLHSARRIDFRGSVSKIGIGRPLSGASALCPKARRDPYSAKLNLYGGATFSEPTLAFIGLKPSFTLFAERRSEYLAFVRTTPIGLSFRGTRVSLTTHRAQDLGFQGEYGRTEAQPAVFCALRNACTPEDREPLLAYRWRTFAYWSTSQNWSNDPQYPTRGGLATLEFRHASKFTGSDPLLRFSKATFDARLYIPLTSGTVLAPRLRMGVVAAEQGSSIPVEERMYAGGGGSVRGFPANELGPTIYIARGFDTVRAPGATGEIAPAESVFFRVRAGATAQRPVPTGGSALVVANLEVRQRLNRYIQGSMFVDAGETWNPNAARAEDRYSGLKITPGIGARYASLIGAVGVDVAYNRYGPRPGAIYFDTPIALGGQLFCVSPGNTLPITGLGGSTQPVQAVGACPATFRPPNDRSFWSRLQLTLSIGQSF
jgi:hypothetical protein